MSYTKDGVSFTPDTNSIYIVRSDQYANVAYMFNGKKYFPVMDNINMWFEESGENVLGLYGTDAISRGLYQPGYSFGTSSGIVRDINPTWIEYYPDDDVSKIIVEFDYIANAYGRWANFFAGFAPFEQSANPETETLWPNSYRRHFWESGGGQTGPRKLEFSTAGHKGELFKVWHDGNVGAKNLKITEIVGVLHYTHEYLKKDMFGNSTPGILPAYNGVKKSVFTSDGQWENYEDVGIVRAYLGNDTEPFNHTWLQDASGNTLVPNENALYMIMDGNYKRRFFIWIEEDSKYRPAGTPVVFGDEYLDDLSKMITENTPAFAYNNIPTGRTRRYTYELTGSESKFEIQFYYSLQYNSKIYVGITGKMVELSPSGGTTYTGSFEVEPEDVNNGAAFAIESYFPGVGTNYHALNVNAGTLKIYNGRVMSEVSVVDINKQSIKNMSQEAIAELKSVLGLS